MTTRTLDSVACCYVYYLALPAFLIPAISTTQVHPPTWASPIFVPASPTSTRGYSSTWELLISFPSYQLPTETYYPFRLLSYYMPISPPLLLLLLASRKSSRVKRSCFPVASLCHHTSLLRPLYFITYLPCTYLK